MSLQDIRQHEHTDEAKASAALPVLNRDSFPRVLRLNNNRMFFTARNKNLPCHTTYRVYWTTHVLSGAESFQSFKNKICSPGLSTCTTVTDSFSLCRTLASAQESKRVSRLQIKLSQQKERLGGRLQEAANSIRGLELNCSP